MAGNEGVIKKEGFCEEHSIQCYKMEAVEAELREIRDKLSSVVTREEIAGIVKRLEDAINELKRADSHHYRDIGLIQQSIATIQETLVAYKEAQKEMKEDYKTLMTTVNNIYQLLQTNAQEMVRQAQEEVKEAKSEDKSTNVWSFLKSMSKKSWFVVAAFIIVGVLLTLVIQYADKIIDGLLK